MSARATPGMAAVRRSARGLPCRPAYGVVSATAGDAWADGGEAELDLDDGGEEPESRALYACC